MVYESDFYTTRRSRPSYSTYSVTTTTTPIHLIPGIARVHAYTSTYPLFSSYSTFPTVYHRSIPYVAHKRLVTGTRITTAPSRVIRSPVRVITSPIRVITSPARYVNLRVRPSVIHRAYDRIENKVRTHPHYYATENYLNSASVRAFDDETNDIRNSTNVLLHKVHERVERARSVSPIYYSSRYEDRHGPDSYIDRILGPIKTEANIYDYPRRFTGKSHLASFRIVGDTAYAKRRPTTMYDDDKVRNDVNLLSYYLKNRNAATSAKPSKVIMASAKILDPNRPTRKFTQPKAEEDPNQDIKDKQAARADKFMNTIHEEFDLEKKKAERLEASRLKAEQAVEEEKQKVKREEEARQAELERQEKLAARAAAERAAELERKAEEERLAEEERIAEEERLIEEERLAEEARIAEEERLVEEARLAEEARIAEEERLIEEARLAEEARVAAEEAEEARKAEEQRQREDELARLAELEKIAEEEKEAELARQVAELAEIARQQEAEAQREAEEAAENDETATVEPSVDIDPSFEGEEQYDEPIVEEPQSPNSDVSDGEDDNAIAEGED